MIVDCGCETLLFQSLPDNMVDYGFHSENAKRPPYAGHSHLFALGLILTYYTTLSSHVQAVNCRDISSNYQHCRIHPAGVHSLDCYKGSGYYCMWKHGNHTSEKTYTLIIRQKLLNGKEYCQKYQSITQVVKNIKVFQNLSITAEVYEDKTFVDNKSTICTKAGFNGSKDIMSRCGPPHNVSFRRHSGKLHLKVSWQQETVNVIKNYLVRYKALSSPSWNQTQSQNGTMCTVENLNSSLVYSLQIQCVTNSKCSQCPQSDTYTVPSELTTQPEIERFEENHIVGKTGRRCISLTWKIPAKVIYDSYSVTVAKVSGETSEQMSTSKPEIRLILSYSAFTLSIRAVNNASISPAANMIITQQEGIPSIGDGLLNVTVHSNTSFTVYWKDDLITTYVCYSVEWRGKGEKTVSMSFYQNQVNKRTLSPLSEPLEPYKRYTITLHTRPNRDTCNMKHLNNSESTYGSTQFYYIEGTPVSAPTNISSYNVTVKSAVLEWSSILEEDVRGFLLGYTIHYTELHPSGTERNVTVDPMSNSCGLGDLKSGTAYEVQISGFTQAGAGARSMPYVFKTTDQGHFNANLRYIIITFVVLVTLVIFGPAIIKRTKVLVWPSIPNPGSSNAMQKIGRSCELELLESINPLKVEEGDTNSLQVVNRDEIPANTLALLHASEDEGDSPETTNWIHTENSSRGLLPDTTSNVQQTNLQSSPFAFSSDYTTMEMLNQVMPQGIPVNTDVSEAENSNLTLVKSGLLYIGQFSTSPTLDSEMLTVL